MATQFTPTQVVGFEKIAQYLSTSDYGYMQILKGKALDQTYPLKIYAIRKAVEFVLNSNPNYPTLQKVSDYLYALLGPYGLKAQNIQSGQQVGLPVLTGPANQSVNVGDNATFSVSVAGTGPFTYQWSLNGIPIPGATSSTYTKTNAQLSDSGGLYSVAVTNSAGTVPSGSATLTVSASLTAQWWYGSVDPFFDLNNGIDNLSYQINQTITSGASITINYPTGAQNNQFNVLRFPDTENDVINWFNTSFNFGTVPDAIMRAIISFGGHKYVISRVSMSLDATQTSLVYSH